MLRFTALTLASASLLLGQTARVPPFQRNWSENPAIVQVDAKRDIYAIGDPHADPARLADLLVGAKIIEAVPERPGDVSWTARDSIVVITGDLIDKGTRSLAVIALVRALQTEASKDGGQVIVTMGNHEAEFLADPEGQKTAEFAAELTNAKIDPAAVAACQGDLGQFLCALPFAARVNDWFFSHAGNTTGRSFAKLSADLQNGVDKLGFKTPELVGDDSLLEARLGDTPWFEPDGADALSVLTAFAKALGVKHFVQGHQPGGVLFSDGVKRKAGEMFQRYGLIFLEDTGMSEGVGDSLGAALHISADQNTATAVCFSGAATVIWDVKTNPDHRSIRPCR